MSRLLTKICGVTQPAEVDDLCACGVDFFGLVVDVASPWSISPERARELAARSWGKARPTLICKPSYPPDFARLIRQVGARAIQLPTVTTSEHLRELRGMFSKDELVIVQEVRHTRGRFWKDEQVEIFLAAGADYILLDRSEKLAAAQSGRLTIPEDDLIAFRTRHPQAPVLVAGGITTENVQALVRACGAAGIDVCNSVRCDGRIQKDLVEKLMERLGSVAGVVSVAGASDPGVAQSARRRPPAPAAGQKRRGPRPTLRSYLTEIGPGSHVVAYLTLGDPPERCLQVADDLLAAGALTLELGLPHAEPKEGAVLLASHARALAAGIGAEQALVMFKTLAEQHPDIPLIAVIQASVMAKESEFCALLDQIVAAGAAAVLPVAMAPWQLPALATHAHQRGLQTVVTCPPSANAKLREICLRYCSGCLYVPRGHLTGGSQQFDNIAEFCQTLADETDLPIIVGVGVKTADDVAEICRSPAKAAAVGSALVEHIASGGAAGAFMRGLLSKTI